jgi:hypothetical protein
MIFSVKRTSLLKKVFQHLFQEKAEAVIDYLPFKINSFKLNKKAKDKMSYLE